MTIFHDCYRVETARLQGKDYAEIGTYLVTVCTKDMAHWFGEVRSERMVLNAVGMIVVEEILKTPMLRNNVVIDAWVVMPNHVHMIVKILPSEEMDTVETQRCCVSQFVAECIPLFRRKPGSLSSIVQQIKCACTKRICAAGYKDFQWQPRFHDRILRTDHAVENVRSYIAMNPVMWERDRNYFPPD